MESSNMSLAIQAMRESIESRGKLYEYILLSSTNATISGKKKAACSASTQALVSQQIIPFSFFDCFLHFKLL